MSLRIYVEESIISVLRVVMEVLSNIYCQHLRTLLLISMFKAINWQRRMGCDVFGISQPTDDGGGLPKFSYYNSQIITTLWFHGKRRATGEFFTHCIDLQAAYDGIPLEQS